MAHSIVKLKVQGKISEEATAVFRAPAQLALALNTMNIDVTLVDYTPFKKSLNMYALKRPSHNLRSMTMVQDLPCFNHNHK